MLYVNLVSEIKSTKQLKVSKISLINQMPQTAKQYK